jgi:hypothetical protein
VLDSCTCGGVGAFLVCHCIRVGTLVENSSCSVRAMLCQITSRNSARGMSPGRVLMETFSPGNLQTESSTKTVMFLDTHVTFEHCM